MANNLSENSVPIKTKRSRVQQVPEMALNLYRPLVLYLVRSSGSFERIDMANINSRSITTHHSANTRINADQGATPALIPFAKLSTKVGMGRSRIYALIGEGSFPPPVKIGTSSRWIVSEIDAYIAKLAATRNANLMEA